MLFMSLFRPLVRPSGCSFVLYFVRYVFLSPVTSLFICLFLPLCLYVFRSFVRYLFVVLSFFSPSVLALFRYLFLQFAMSSFIYFVLEFDR